MTLMADGRENSGASPAAFAIPRRERAKHLRYPGAHLYPFVVDCRGKWGKEANTWMRLILRDRPKHGHGELVRSLRVAVSVALQNAVANSLI